SNFWVRGKVERKGGPTAPLHLCQRQGEALPPRHAETESAAGHDCGERGIAEEAERKDGVSQRLGRLQVSGSAHPHQPRVWRPLQDAGEALVDGETVLVALRLEPSKRDHQPTALVREA